MSHEKESLDLVFKRRIVKTSRKKSSFQTKNQNKGFKLEFSLALLMYQVTGKKGCQIDGGCCVDFILSRSSLSIHHFVCCCCLLFLPSTFLETCEETQVVEEEKGKGCVATFDNFKMVVIHFPSLLHVVVSSSSQEM